MWLVTREPAEALGLQEAGALTWGAPCLGAMPCDGRSDCSLPSLLRICLIPTAGLKTPTMRH